MVISFSSFCPFKKPCLSPPFGISPPLRRLPAPISHWRSRAPSLFVQAPWEVSWESKGPPTPPPLHGRTVAGLIKLRHHGDWESLKKAGYFLRGVVVGIGEVPLDQVMPCHETYPDEIEQKSSSLQHSKRRTLFQMIKSSNKCSYCSIGKRRYLGWKIHRNQQEIHLHLWLIFKPAMWMDGRVCFRVYPDIDITFLQRTSACSKYSLK